MKNKIVVSLLLISCSVFSQLPGYLGKRLTIGYANYLSPSLFFPSANSTDRFELGLNTTHCINAEYVIKKRTEFCVSAEFFKTGFFRNNYNYQDDTPSQLECVNLSLGFKFFRPGFIAPVGKYQKLEAVIISNKAYNGRFESRSFAIALTFGRQRVFFNSIIVDTGFRLGVSTNALFNIIIYDVLDFNSPNATTVNYDSELKQDINYRLFGAQLFNFHIGLGFLAF